MPSRVYKTSKGILIHKNDRFYLVQSNWDDFVNQEDLYGHVQQVISDVSPIETAEATEYLEQNLMPPIGSQEVWAAGVTYLRSRDARMEESKDSGGADCYQKVYEAERPELFFKSLPHRVAGHGQVVNIRKDSIWNVPEPELTLYINSSGKIQGYTIGNDMSSRSIEGENPLYLPQAKVYEYSAALGPCLLVQEQSISPESIIHLEIHRAGKLMFEDSTPLSRMKRSLTELAEYLYRGCDYREGCYLMTGTCLVPPNEFTLNVNDEVTIRIDGIGTLKNTVGKR
jgi:2-dehydro-3-deoxy-D-arabinonate dehydratase